jgi:hypothetical protein
MLWLLRGILIFNGALTLCALPAVFLPTSLMESFHAQLDIGAFPDAPLVQYLARSVSGLYAAFGSLTLVLAYDVRRFAPLVTWWGVTAIVFGLLLFWIDYTANMPPHWTYGECPYLVLTGLAVLALQAATRRSKPRE